MKLSCQFLVTSFPWIKSPKSDLREGSRYCSSGVSDLLTELLERYQNKFPKITRLLRGDSGFAAPSIYESCEKTGSKYVIRLKANQVLQREARAIFDEAFDEGKFQEDQVIIGEYYTKQNLGIESVVSYLKLSIMMDNWYVISRILSLIWRPKN